MKNYFIIHGSFGSSQDHWFPWLENQIKCGGGSCYNLDFPVGENRQTYQNWEMVLNSVKRFINEESVFFCHSIACIFLVKYCIRNNIKIGKAIMISGFNQMLGLDEDYDNVNCTMYTNQAEKFKDLCKERVCYLSENDPYVKYDKLIEFAKLIDAKTIISKTAGHFNRVTGYTKFEELLQYVDTKQCVPKFHVNVIQNPRKK